MDNVKNQKSSTALHTAAFNRNVEEVKRLLAQSSIDINAKGEQGRTALQEAALEGHHKVVKLLLAHPGIDINTKNDYDGTALSLASYQKHGEVVKMLLEEGAALEGKDVTQSLSHLSKTARDEGLCQLIDQAIQKSSESRFKPS